MPLFDADNRLTLTEDGFRQQKAPFQAVEIPWSDIDEAFGIKRDLLTYPDNFIVLVTNQERVTLSEADPNFRDIEPCLLSNLPGFPPDWYQRIDAQSFDTPVSLWKRQN
jgi:hypothetical protein